MKPSGFFLSAAAITYGPTEGCHRCQRHIDLGSSDRLTLRDVVRLGTFNCRTLLSEVRQQELVRFMKSRQIDVLADINPVQRRETWRRLAKSL